MTAREEVEEQARILRAYLAEKGIEISKLDAAEAVARMIEAQIAELQKELKKSAH